MQSFVVSSVEGFVQQLAVGLIARGYWFYVTGHIPPGKDLPSIDAKLSAKYDLAISKWARARRRRLGLANVRYLRFDRFFVLAATPGRHSFFVKEPAFRDIRERSISIRGYCIGCRRGVDGKWHPSVRIHPRYYAGLKSVFLELAVHASVERLAEAFRCSGFEPYAPVRRQMFNLLRAVNSERQVAGLEQVPQSVIRLRRRVVRPFQPGGVVEQLTTA